MKKKIIKRIIIVGGTNGIGFELALKYLQLKFEVFVIGRNDINIKNYKKINFIKCDLSDKNQLNELKIAIKKKYFPYVIQATGGTFGINDLSNINDLNQVWMLNSAIPIVLNEIFLKNMKKNKFGRIVHISSAVVNNLKGRVPYNCSKSYLNTYIKSICKTYASLNILINGMMPGAIWAKNNNLYKFINTKVKVNSYLKNNLSVNNVGTVNSIFPIIKFMLSEENDYMVGSLIEAEGGEK